MQLISRKDAIKQNLTYYFTGKPCKRGHLSNRIVVSANCVECGLLHKLNERRSDPEAHRALKAAEYARNKDTILEQQAAYRKANWSVIYEKRKNDPEYQAYMANYLANYELSEDSKAVLAANVRYRQCCKRQQTPKWVTKEERAQMAEIYKRARRLTNETGIKHVVDHIVPILGKTVRGLHCLANLQILTAEENRKKSNHFCDN